jgi:hypothetical protein
MFCIYPTMRGKQYTKLLAPSRALSEPTPEQWTGRTNGSSDLNWEEYANPAHPCPYLITKDRTISAANIVAARMAMRFRSEYT